MNWFLWLGCFVAYCVVLDRQDRQARVWHAVLMIFVGTLLFGAALVGLILRDIS